MLFYIGLFIFGCVVLLCCSYYETEQQSKETEEERYSRKFRESLDK